MSIRLRTKNRYFNRRFMFNKNPGENIYIDGSCGSGRLYIALSFLNEFLLDRDAPTSSIVVTFDDDKVSIIEFFSRFESPGVTTTVAKEMFAACSIQKGEFIFVGKKHRIIAPATSFKNDWVAGKEVRNQQVFELLRELPENTGPEIPIIIDDITHFSCADLAVYNDILLMLNKKGYFFITTTRGLFDDTATEERSSLLKYSHLHTLIAKSEYKVNQQFYPGIANLKAFNELLPGDFYYFNGGVLAHKTPLQVKCYD